MDNYLTEDEIKMLEEEQKRIQKELVQEEEEKQKKFEKYLTNINKVKKDTEQKINDQENLNQESIDNVLISMKASNFIKSLAKYLMKNGPQEIEHIENNIEEEIHKLNEVLSIVSEINVGSKIIDDETIDTLEKIDKNLISIEELKDSEKRADADEKREQEQKDKDKR